MPFIVPAIAAIGPAIGASATWFAGAGIIGKTLINVGLAVGLNYLAKELAPDQKVDQQQNVGAVPGSGGVETSIQLGADVPRFHAFGMVARYGHLTYKNSYGDDNKFFEQVVDLSTSYCDGMENYVIIDGKRTFLTQVANVSNEDERYTINGYGDKIQIAFYSGKPGQLINNELVTNANPAGRWGGGDVKAGICYVYVRYEWDEELFSDGRIPRIKFVFRGTKLYDWRKDSTVPGGSGSHRWDQPNTYEYSDTPAVVAYNVLRGIKVSTNNSHVFGLTARQIDINHDFFTAAANACEEQVPLDGGGTQKRYRVSAIAQNNKFNQFWDTTVNSMAGWVLEVGGKMAVMAGTAQPIYRTLTEADVVSEERFTYSGNRSRIELVNGVFGTYTNSDDLWEITSYPPLTSSLYESQDGETLRREMNVNGVPAVQQAERISKIRLLETRYQTQIAMVLYEHHVDLQAGYWVVFNSTKYGPKTFRIVERKTDHATRRVHVYLDEISPAVYDWNTSEEKPPPASGTFGDIGALQGQITLTSVVQGEDNQGKLVIRYPAITDPTVTQVNFLIRDVSSSENTNPVPYSDSDGSDGVTVWYGAESGVIYEVAAQPQTEPNRNVPFGPYLQAQVIEQLTFVNWVKNAHFQSGQIYLNTAADLLKIPNYYLIGGYANGNLGTAVLPKFATEVPDKAGIPAQYSHVLRMDSSSDSVPPEVVVWTEYDPNEAAATGRGVPVEIGDQVTTHLIGTVPAGDNIATLRYELWVKPYGGGAPVAQVNKRTGATFAEQQILANDWSESIPTFATVRWEIATAGTAFWKITPTLADRYVYITGLEIVRQQSGRILGEQQIVEQAYQFISIGQDDRTGSGMTNFEDAVVLNVTGNITKGEKFLIVCEANFNVSFTGAGNQWDAQIRCDDGTTTQTGYSSFQVGYDIGFRQASLQFEGRGVPTTYRARLLWAGPDPSVVLTQRDLSLKLMKK